MKFKPLIILRLSLRFFLHCVLSGLTTARMILMRSSPSSGLVNMPYEPMSNTGVAILGAIVTLTPGTSTIDINPKQREILLHLLDIRTAEKSIAVIRRDFEKDICALFPKGLS